jgi:reverse gyrase
MKAVEVIAMTATTHINALRQAIYQVCGVMGFSKGYRSRKLRQVCEAARGLDLRTKADVVTLATRLGLLGSNVVLGRFGAAIAA